MALVLPRDDAEAQFRAGINGMVLWRCHGNDGEAYLPIDSSLFGSFHHAERAPRVISSLTAESPTIQKL
jgi:hypothetical protein